MTDVDRKTKNIVVRCLRPYKGYGLLRERDVTTVDEEVSPSLENMIVLTWLRLINTALPKLVKQRYGTELRTITLSSIKPEISQALDSLLDEITSAEDAKVMRTAAGARSQTGSGRRNNKGDLQTEIVPCVNKPVARTYIIS